MVSYTGRYAHLVGYDPATTKSGKIPIVSADIKVMAFNNIPVLLRIHETPYNEGSPITLLSEYQIREHRLILDSVASKHKTGPKSYGTQRFHVNEHVHIPFVDRGGLMGCEAMPYEDGNDEKYDIIEITHSDKWVPARFKQKKNKKKEETRVEFPEFDAQLQTTRTVEQMVEAFQAVTIPE